MTPDDIKAAIGRAIPGIDLAYDVYVRDLPRQFDIEISITSGVTFAMLQALSEALGTDKIDIRPAEEGQRYSSWTYDPATPAKIVVYLAKDPKDWTSPSSPWRERLRPR